MNSVVMVSTGKELNVSKISANRYKMYYIIVTNFNGIMNVTSYHNFKTPDITLCLKYSMYLGLYPRGCSEFL